MSVQQFNSNYETCCCSWDVVLSLLFMVYWLCQKKLCPVCVAAGEEL